MRKAIGAIMLALGCLFAIGSVGTLPNAISHIGTVTAEKGWTAYVYGYVGGQIFLMVAAYLLIKFGLRLSKSKQESNK